MNYEKKKLKDCCVSISDGDHLPPPKAETGIPFITISNIDGNNQLDFSDVMYVPEEYYDGLPANKKASVGDILYSVVGSFGKPVYISNSDKFVFQRHIAILKPTNKMNGKYLYYTMLNPMFYRMADKMAIGCAQRTITLDALRNIVVDIPPIEKQKSITDVLNSIDGKIAVNNRINDNLEQMAYDTYMHLFFKKQPNGKLGEIIVENNKSSVQVGEAKGKRGDYPFFTSGDAILELDCSMVDGRNCFLNTGGNAGVKFHIGEAAYSTDTWCITANSYLEDYLYLLLLSIKPELNQKFFQGTGLKHLQKPLLKDRLIYIPSEEEIKSFNSKVQPLMDMVSANTRENKRLINLRDWLLPMLMNGQATVSN